LQVDVLVDVGQLGLVLGAEVRALGRLGDLDEQLLVQRRLDVVAVYLEGRPLRAAEADRVDAHARAGRQLRDLHRIHLRGVLAV